ncbi:MAG: hypothetical protein ACMUIP_11105, partial [bacterium]
MPYKKKFCLIFFFIVIISLCHIIPLSNAKGSKEPKANNPNSDADTTATDPQEKFDQQTDILNDMGKSPADDISAIINALSQIIVPQKAKKEIDNALKELAKAKEEFVKNKILKAFDKIKKAVKHLLNAQKKGATVYVIQECTDACVNLVKGIADKTLQKAIALVGENTKHIAKAQKHYIKALDHLAMGNEDKAIGELKHVYKEALKALGEWVPETFEEMLEERILDIQEMDTEEIPSKALNHLKKAEDELSKALKELDKENLEKALDKLKSVVKELENANEKGADTLFIIELLCENIEDVVYMKIAYAESLVCAYNNEIIKAWEKFDAALVKIDEGEYKEAIDYFKEAVKIAEKIFTDKKGKKSVEFVEDQTAPLITITSPTDGSFLSTHTPAIKGTVYEECSFATILINGQPGIKGGEWPNYTFSGQIMLDDGEHEIECIAIDGAGNEAAAQIAVVVDTHAPDLSIISPEDTFVSSQRAISVSGRVEDIHLLPHVIINDIEVPISQDSFVQTIILTEGENTITISAHDKAGNETNRILTVTYIPDEIDTTPPVITFLSPKDGSRITEERVQIIGTVVDQSPITLSLTLQNQEILFTLVGVNFSCWVECAEGDNEIIASATDSSGNESTLSMTIVRDTTPPSAPEFTFVPASPTNSDRITLSGTGEPGMTITVTGGAETFSTTVSDE